MGPPDFAPSLDGLFAELIRGRDPHDRTPQGCFRECLHQGLNCYAGLAGSSGQGDQPARVLVGIREKTVNLINDLLLVFVKRGQVWRTRNNQLGIPAFGRSAGKVVRKAEIANECPGGTTPSPTIRWLQACFTQVISQIMERIIAMNG
jgi:hypothetical protein